MSKSDSFKLALVGQPNCGKTSFFNKLTGSNQQVGNWPGVTVEKKEGHFKVAGKGVEVIDLPGIYSLSSYTLEERVTRQFLLEEGADLVINIVDANQLERQLFLTLQLLMMNIPVVLVLNMMDEVKGRGVTLDSRRLEELLGVPVVEAVAREGKGVSEAITLIEQEIDSPGRIKNSFIIPEGEFSDEIAKMAELIGEITELRSYSFWYGLKFFEQDSQIDQELSNYPELYSRISELRRGFRHEKGIFHDQIVQDWLYSITNGIQKEVVREGIKAQTTQKKIREFLDLVLINKYLGIPIFASVMLLVFTLTFIVGDIIIGFLERGVEWLTAVVALIPNPVVVSLLNDGIITGVGNVVLLIPYIFIMFFLMAMLEDSGYMARAAFVMDSFMHRIGLHGKSFIPLVMGFGCNVPAIMAARSLDSHEERLKTVFMLPFVPCSVRIQVFMFFAAAFFARAPYLIVGLLCIMGVAISILTGLLLSKTVIKKRSAGLIMELPVYRLPHLKNTFLSTLPKIKEYFVKAGTIIFGFSVVLWFLSFFPYGVEFGGEKSLIGLMGKGIGHIMRPLGFDWKLTVGLITGFFAKEIVVTSVSILYTGQDVSTIMSPLVAFSYMVFILIYVPCVGTVSVIKSETNSWKWTAFSVVYSIGVAWIVSFLITNLGRLILSLF